MRLELHAIDSQQRDPQVFDPDWEIRRLFVHKGQPRYFVPQQAALPSRASAPTFFGRTSWILLTAASHIVR